MGNPPIVAPGQTSGVAVSLGIDAPAGGVTISFVSSDTNVATITPSVFIPEGLRIPAANPQITGVTPGASSFTASAAGFAPDSKGVTVTLTLSFTPADQLRGHRRPNVEHHAQPVVAGACGGLTLNTSIDNTALATVPATVFVAAGTHVGSSAGHRRRRRDDDGPRERNGHRAGERQRQGRSDAADQHRECRRSAKISRWQWAARSAWPRRRAAWWSRSPALTRRRCCSPPLITSRAVRASREP